VNKYHVIINGNKHIVLQENQMDFTVNNSTTLFNVQKKTDFRFIVENENKFQECFLIKSDGNEHIIFLDGKYIQVTVNTELENFTKKIIANKTDSGIVNISSPMPGLLNKIFVTTGNNIEIGDALFELEAMKMKNVVKSEIKGKVIDIKQKEGKSVEKGAGIITIQT
jgi:propionyl-CoA carboxylase alpha chain